MKQLSSTVLLIAGWSLVGALSLVAAGSAKQSVFDIRKPTVIAFFPPVTQAELNKDPDTNESLSDFQLYAKQVREPLRNRGIEFHELYAHSFRIRVGAKTTTFHPGKVEVGYYFADGKKAPRVEYGVLTDTDVVHIADEYFGAQAKQDFSESTLWHWFDTCGGEERQMGVEVLLDGKVIHQSSFPICPISDRSKTAEHPQKIVAFSFRGGHTFQGEYYTSPSQEIEGNIWQAGTDPGVLLLGVSFSTKKQVLLNTIHIAKSSTLSRSEIDRGLIVRTFPVGHK